MHRILVEQSPNAVALVDKHLEILIPTRQWDKDYAASGETTTGKTLHEIFELPQSLKQLFADCVEEERAGTFPETEIDGHDGRKYWIRGHLNPWLNDDQSFGGHIVFMTNCTQEKTLKEQLEVEQEQFRGAFESSVIGMALVGLDGRWLQMNSSLLELLGYSKEELLLLTFQDITHQEDLQKDLDLLGELIAGRKNTYQMEKRYFHKQGHIVWALLSVSIVRDQSGRPIHFVSQVMDISAAKKMEQQRLRELDGTNHRIAYDLHENIAQRIAALKWMCQTALKESSGEHSVNISNELSELIEEVKRLSEAIIPTTFLGDSVYHHLESLLLSHSEAQSTPMQIMLDDRLKYITLKEGYHVYRIIENYTKLAHRTRCDITSINIRMKKVLMVEIVYADQSFKSETLSNDILWSDIVTRLDILEGSMVSSNHDSESGLVKLLIPENKLV